MQWIVNAVHEIARASHVDTAESIAANVAGSYQPLSVNLTAWSTVNPSQYLPNTSPVTKAAGTYTAVAADRNQFWRATGAVTVNLTAAATLGTGWGLWVKGDGGAVTVDPDGSEQINGSSTALTIPNGVSALILCSGAAFFAITFGDVTLTGAQTLSNKTFVTPVLGAATATSINKVAFTAPATGATITIPDGVTLTGPASSGTAMTLGNAETVSGVKTFSAIPILSGGGMTFPATQVPSADANTIDDYEEGTWTPAVTLATPGNLSVAYSSRSGRYVKIGQMVFFNCLLQTSTWTHTTASGFFNITGFPFTMGSQFVGAGTLLMSGWTKANYTSLGFETSNSTFMYALASGSAQALAELVAADLPTGGVVRIYGAGHYTV